MPVKSESASPSPESSSDPFTPPKQKRKATDTQSTDSSEKKSSSAKTSPNPKKAKSSPATSTMTLAIKEALIDHMMKIACSAVKKEELASQLGISKKQLVNAICSGRVNLRSKLVKAAREL